LRSKNSAVELFAPNAETQPEYLMDDTISTLRTLHFDKLVEKIIGNFDGVYGCMVGISRLEKFLDALQYS